ncbi:cytochrome P450 [Henriciella aquimarina]|uniref:cytochrome P450 n=1 Tax=Henriciella aquimarina TaxID=545261 RepID=UPI001F445FD3|nr:cytochrome P450 [Henriciella aquimarina]
MPEHVPEDRVFDLDIYNDSRFTEDLHESYATLHNDAPDIFYTPRNGGHWVFTRFDDMVKVLRDYKHFSVREMQIPRVENPPVFIPLSLDPPQSVPYRQALMPYFTLNSVQALEPRVREFAREIIDAVAARGECDFVEEVSARFPVSVFMELMGMPLNRLKEFREIAEAFFNTRDNETMGILVGKIVALMTEIVEMRKSQPEDDLISQMVNFEIEGRPVTLEELQSMLLIMFLGGMDTVTNVASYAFRHLAADKALQARLRKDPEIIPAFVEEAIRCFAVVNSPRIVTHDFEMFGLDFREGDMVLCLLPLGGRDGRRFEKPNDFDPDRKAQAHITFSAGPHMCLGSNLARMELRILVEEWTRKIPEFSTKPNTRHTSRAGTVMALESLPLVWKP